MYGFMKKTISLLLSVVMITAAVAVPGSFASAHTAGSCQTAVVGSYPTGDWQNEVTFPDWAGYVDDTLAMNSLFSFTGFSGQGSFYLKGSSDITGMELFVNGVRVDVSPILNHPGQVVRVDYSQVAVNGTNTIEVTNITPDTATVEVKIPYATVIDGTPSDVGMNEDTLKLIDDIMKTEIKYGFSAAQLAVVKDGKMVIDQAWGTVDGWTEDQFDENGNIVTPAAPDKSSAPVTTDTLFDLASNTKMYATNFAVQKLVTDGLLDIDQKVSYYIPEFQDQPGDAITGKGDLTVREILQHQAGFPADPQYNNENSAYIQAHPDLYCQNRDQMLDTIIRTPLEYQPGTKTQYSDVDYMLLDFIVERITGKRLDVYLQEDIYGPMGLTHTTYNPLKNGFEKDDCAATELNGNTRRGTVNFNGIRTDTIQGEVHDEKAYYSMDGVSGHAGLFSNAEEVAMLCQVMLNGGGYGNNAFFSKDVIDEFTKPKSIDNANWGLGWWREADNSSRMYYFGPQSSSSTYGHQGWTGTITVIDPESNLVIVLLTNKKNSPVIDPASNLNDFVCDNYTVGALGIISGLIYESLNTHNIQATDANLYTMVTDRLKVLDGCCGQYDETVHLADACAMVDVLVTRAEERNTPKTKEYAKKALATLSDIVEHKLVKNESKDLGNQVVPELTARLNAVSGNQSESSDVSKCTVTQLSSLPANADAQASLAYPSQLGSPTTSKILAGNLFTFKGYQNQGTLYITVKDAQKAEGLRIFINGAEVDTSQMLAHPGVPFAVDYSRVAVNNRNTIQVSGMAENVPPQSAVQIDIPYPTVISGAPEDVGMDADILNEIDTIINNDIGNGFTAAELAVIKDGELVKNTAYGTLNSYNQDGTPKTDSPAVTTDTLFDIASNTKMYATNFAVQKLVTEGLLDINAKVSAYIPGFASQPDKKDLTVKEILEHQAGFPADPQYFNNNAAYIQAHPDLYCQERDQMLEKIIETPLEYQPGTKTQYSDVDYMLLGFIVEAITGQQLDEYVEQNIYRPMGLDHILYNPLEKGYSQDDCAATELNGNTRDGQIEFNNVRDYTLQGEVHDEKAYYCMEGVSGHAGLFATAEDLASLAQTVLNDGGYGTTKVFSKNVGEFFTSKKDSSAVWGLGWWREGDAGRPWYFGIQSARSTVGHQGWTGTLTLIDPVNNLVMVLLTNKINTPIETEVGVNSFDGNYYTTATLGAISNLLYQAINPASVNGSNDNLEATDALLADMANEKIKLLNDPENSAVSQSSTDPLVRATYSIIQTVLDRAVSRNTPQTLAYAEKAVRLLNFDRDSEKIEEFNAILLSLGGDPYLPDDPNPNPEPTPEPTPDPMPNPDPTSNDPSNPENGNNNNSNGTGTEPENGANTTSDENSPSTSDPYHIFGALTAAFLSIGAIGITIKRKETKTEEPRKK